MRRTGGWTRLAMREHGSLRGVKALIFDGDDTL